MSRRRVDLFSIVNLFNEPRTALWRLLLLAPNGHAAMIAKCPQLRDAPQSLLMDP
jgi:hypothetical protein